MQIWLTHLLPKENLQVEIFSNQYIINEWHWVSYEELYGDQGGCYPSRAITPSSISIILHMIWKPNSITGFFNSCILFIDAMFITEPAISSTSILGLGSKLYSSKMQCMINKDLTWFMQSLSEEWQNWVTKKRLLWQGVYDCAAGKIY